MPKKVPEYLTYFLADCLESNPLYTVKAMFGGYSIYYEGKIFAIYAWDTIYMKVGENNLSDYIEVGSKQFEFEQKSGKISRMRYYTLPEEIIENRDELQIWIQKSLENS